MTDAQELLQDLHEYLSVSHTSIPPSTLLNRSRSLLRTTSNLISAGITHEAVIGGVLNQVLTLFDAIGSAVLERQIRDDSDVAFYLFQYSDILSGHGARTRTREQMISLGRAARRKNKRDQYVWDEREE